MSALPTGTVTFLFTDIEGSTRLIQELDDAASNQVFADHRRLLLDAVELTVGHLYQDQGESFLFVFARARDAVLAAINAQRALQTHHWPGGAMLRVRMALHTGEPVTTAEGYLGVDIHRVARICQAGHGGQILVSQTTRELVGDDLPGEVTLRDLGEHRLKDLARAQRLFQVVIPGLPAVFPPLRSADVLRNNLPIQLTSFIGRDQEIVEVQRLLLATRLLTLIGAGGVGKTRLALQVAAEVLEEFKDGVWLVELAALSDPALPPRAVASALGVTEPAGRLLIETLTDYLRPKSLLLQLDNCEHLLPACAHLSETLLRTCPNLRILATSREALGIPGEAIWSVPSLSLPDARRPLSVEEAMRSEAVRLFVERAVASQPGFALTDRNAPAVAKVCQRLDGIPLAIELAAARTKVLSVSQIAERLDDRFRLLTGGSRTGLPRHKTLRAAMDWSYDLLADTERVLLRRLAVFAGGWTLEAAEAVCSGDGVEAADVLDLLTQLVDKSLVTVETGAEEARYGLLETVREYDRDRLLEAGEAADVWMRHRDWYLRLAERAEPELRGPRQGVWLERLETEHENLRAALEWSLTEKGGAQAGLRLAGALQWFWFVHGHWSEGRKWLEGALARSSDAAGPDLLKVLLGIAYLAYRRGDYGRVMVVNEKGLALSRELGHKEGSALFLINSGLVALHEGDYERATVQLEDSLALCRELGHTWLVSLALGNLGAVSRHKSDYRQAEAYYEECLVLSREVGDKRRIAYSLRNLGIVAVHQTDYGRAEVFFTEGLTLSGEFRDPYIIEGCLEGMAAVACAQGHYGKATRLLGSAEALRETFGLRLTFPDQADHDQRVVSARDALGDAPFAAAWIEGRAMTLEEAIDYAMASDA